jgi:hypothetical protein
MKKKKAAIMTRDAIRATTMPAMADPFMVDLDEVENEGNIVGLGLIVGGLVLVESIVVWSIVVELAEVGLTDVGDDESLGVVYFPS